ncbi:MAG: GLPGLI family protein [Flavobacteriales bacterium]|nr:GLPGLI family protein [Flavobacteriales bacterium]
MDIIKNFILLRKIFLICVIILSSVLYSQNANIEVGYTQFLDLGKPTQSEWILYFDSSKSLFIEKSKPKFLDLNDSTLNNSDFLKNKVFITSSADINRSLLTDFKADSLWHHTYILSKTYMISEAILKPKWDVIDEFKSIDSYVVQKAITTFRGRNYTAWFSLEFPVSFGPWKLNSLPGLILEVYDELNQVHFIVNKINSSPENLLDSRIEEITARGEKILLKEFVKLEDKEGDEIQKQVISKISRAGFENRNLTVSGFESAGRKYKLEIIYEWE